MVVNNGVWFVDVTICQSAHAQYGAASQFATEIGKICTLRVFAFSNRSPTKVSRLGKIARDVLCQCLAQHYRRFKLIYFYDESKDVVTIMDVWDTKMNPQNLVKRIR